MKLQLIENICKQTVSLVLLTGICLLYRTFTLIVKIIIALTVMGMLV